MDIADDYDFNSSFYQYGPGASSDYDYSNEGENYVNSGDYYSHEGLTYTDPASTQPNAPGTGGSPINIPDAEGDNPFSKFLSGIAKFVTGGGSGGGKGLFGGAGGINPLTLILALAMGEEARKRTPSPTGGGTTMGLLPPREYNKRVVNTRRGPIVRYAHGGLTALKSGGPVAMEDGGFVMTKRAVDGAGGPQGIRSLIPNAKMVRGPGTGTSDDIPAVIFGREGATPAALSNGEAYVPKRTVQNMGGAQQLYSLMHNLQKRA
jgi:hypothetical protein